MRSKFPILRYAVLLVCIFASGAVLLQTSQMVQRKEAELNRFKNKLQHEKQMVGVLQAEWAQLNSPYRLEDLVQDRLDLRMPDTENIAPVFDDLPDAQDVLVLEGQIDTPDLKIDVVTKSVVVKPAKKPNKKPVEKPKSIKQGVSNNISTQKPDTENHDNDMSGLLNRLNNAGDES